MSAADRQIAPDLLHRLLTAGDAPVPPSALSAASGRAESEILADLDGLRAAGCSLDVHPHHGVRLLATSLECWADYVEPRHAAGLGRRLVVYRQTASTQDAARQLLTAADPLGADGTVVVADHQTGGRGRLGRRWFAPPGAALLLTAVLDARRASIDRLVLGSCVALARAVERLTGLAPAIRWPNDLLLDDAKLAGILVETVGPVALVGIGVNVAVDPADLPADDAGRSVRATSLLAHHARVDRLLLLDALLDELDRILAGEPDDTLRQTWRDRSSLWNRRITVDSAGQRLTGRVVDLDPHHGLMLEVERGPVVTIPAATASLVLD